jgi:hypothetical protein
MTAQTNSNLLNIFHAAAQVGASNRAEFDSYRQKADLKKLWSLVGNDFESDTGFSVKFESPTQVAIGAVNSNNGETVRVTALGDEKFDVKVKLTVLEENASIEKALEQLGRFYGFHKTGISNKPTPKFSVGGCAAGPGR